MKNEVGTIREEDLEECKSEVYAPILETDECEEHCNTKILNTKSDHDCKIVNNSCPI